MSDSAPITAALKRAPVGLHAGGEHWGLAWGALEWLEENVQPGWSTLEIGSGSSTLVIGSRGATHSVVTPDPAERDNIHAAARELGIDLTAVTFHIGLSQDVLPVLEPTPLDLVLVDGAHGFPYPVLDWWNVSRHVKVGGHVLLDDAYLPGVSPIVDFVRRSPAWRLEPAVSFRTAHVVKVSDEPPASDAGQSVATRDLRFAYLPPHRRVVASTRQRVFGTSAGIWVVERARAMRLRRSDDPSEQDR